MSLGFPGITNPNRRTIRSPENPMDKCTIVSIYPKDIIDEVKPTIQPGKFSIPAGSYEEPSILVVGPSSWWREIDEDQPLLEIPNSSIQVADSIVRDYCNGIVGCNMGDSMPGIFFIPGALGMMQDGDKEIFSITKARTDLKTRYKGLLDKARTNQTNWYKVLINLADTDWARHGGNPLVISDDMRLAARELGQNTKEWLQNYQMTETVKCIACGHLRNPLYPICPNCKTVIDTEKAKKLNLKFAE